jgi:hypothetical protein
MKRQVPFILSVAIILIFALAPAAHAQSFIPCTASQSAAVKCFVNNAVTTDILTVPAGMTSTSYQSYAVAVLRIVQSTNTSVILLGTTSAIADAMPPTNENGMPNESAQANAINSIIGAEINTGLIALPTQTTQVQLVLFAQQTAANMSGFSGVSLSPGSVLRLIDSYIVTATSSSGTVNWTQVDASLATAVNNLNSSGLMKLPSTVTQAEFTTFVEDVAQSISTYKSATGKKTL